MGETGTETLSRVVVLGATGFIGRQLSQRIPNSCHPPAGWRLGDLGAARQWLRELRPTLVVNATGLLRGDDAEIQQVNEVEPIRFMDLLGAEVPNVTYLHFGSAAEYGPQTEIPVREEVECHPTWQYGRAKLAASLHALARPDLRTIVVRPSNVVGHGMSGSMLIGKLLEQVRNGETTLAISRRDAVRDYVDVRDVAEAVLRLVSNSEVKGVFNISSGIGYTNEAVVQMIRDATGSEIYAEYADEPIHAHEVDTFIASNEKLFEATGFRPAIPLPVSIKDAWGAG